MPFSWTSVPLHTASWLCRRIGDAAAGFGDPAGMEAAACYVLPSQGRVPVLGGQALLLSWLIWENCTEQVAQ